MIDDEYFKHTEQRLNHLENRMDTLDARQQEIAENTKEIVEILRGAKGLRSLVVWLTPIAVVIYWVLERVHFK